MIDEDDKLKRKKRILQDGEVLHVSMSLMDAQQRAVAFEDAQAEYKQRLSEAWRDPVRSPERAPPPPQPTGDVRQDTYAAQDHMLTNAWRGGR